MVNFLAMARCSTLTGGTAPPTCDGDTTDEMHQPGADPGATAAPTGGLILQEFTWTDPTTPIAAEKRKTQEQLPNQPMRVPIKK